MGPLNGPHAILESRIIFHTLQFLQRSAIQCWGLISFAISQIVEVRVKISTYRPPRMLEDILNKKIMTVVPYLQ